MSEWYYVQGSDRVGPVGEEEIESLLESGVLGAESFVWKKGLDNWMRLKSTELKSKIKVPVDPNLPELPPIERKDIDWKKIDHLERIFTIKIGLDRGGDEVEYGPYSLDELKRSFAEGRINGKTLIFTPGMEHWQFLADTPLYRMEFSSEIPAIEEKERRENRRKPFVARMLFHDSKKVYEGICRDVSIGGLQVLVASCPVHIGDRITLNVHPENSGYNFVASGKVVRLLDGGQGFSLRFEGLSFESQKAISDYIEKSTK